MLRCIRWLCSAALYFMTHRLSSCLCSSFTSILDSFLSSLKVVHESLKQTKVNFYITFHNTLHTLQNTHQNVINKAIKKDNTNTTNVHRKFCINFLHIAIISTFSCTIVNNNLRKWKITFDKTQYLTKTFNTIDISRNCWLAMKT